MTVSALAVDQIMSQRQMLAAEQGELGLQLACVDVAALLESQVTLFPPPSGRRAPPHRARCSRTGMLHTDPSLLARIVSNLVKNALEATPEGASSR